MELHKMGSLIGNGLGWLTLGLALACMLVLIGMSVTSLLRHRHA